MNQSQQQNQRKTLTTFQIVSMSMVGIGMILGALGGDTHQEIFLWSVYGIVIIYAAIAIPYLIKEHKKKQRYMQEQEQQTSR